MMESKEDPTIYSRSFETSMRFLSARRATGQADSLTEPGIPLPEYYERPRISRSIGAHFVKGFRGNVTPQQIQYQSLIQNLATPKHTTLESPTGQWMKEEMNLPYQSHSATDINKAANFYDKAVSPPNSDSLSRAKLNTPELSYLHTQLTELTQKLNSGDSNWLDTVKSSDIASLFTAPTKMHLSEGDTSVLNHALQMQSNGLKKINELGVSFILPEAGEKFNSEEHLSDNSGIVWVRGSASHNLIASTKTPGIRYNGKVLQQATITKYMEEQVNKTTGPDTKLPASSISDLELKRIQAIAAKIPGREKICEAFPSLTFRAQSLLTPVLDTQARVLAKDDKWIESNIDLVHTHIYDTLPSIADLNHPDAFHIAQALEKNQRLARASMNEMGFTPISPKVGDSLTPNLHNVGIYDTTYVRNTELGENNTVFGVRHTGLARNGVVLKKAGVRSLVLDQEGVPKIPIDSLPNGVVPISDRTIKPNPTSGVRPVVAPAPTADLNYGIRPLALTPTETSPGVRPVMPGSLSFEDFQRTSLVRDPEHMERFYGRDAHKDHVTQLLNSGRKEQAYKGWEKDYPELLGKVKGKQSPKAEVNAGVRPVATAPALAAASPSTPGARKVSEAAPKPPLPVEKMTQAEYIEHLISKKQIPTYTKLVQHPSRRTGQQLVDPNLDKAIESYEQSWHAAGIGPRIKGKHSFKGGVTGGSFPGMQGLSGGEWFHLFQKNAGSANPDGTVDKGYLTFKDPLKDVTVDSIVDYHEKLEKAGYHGQIKVHAYGGNAHNQFDNVVMHGENRADVDIAFKIAHEHFGEQIDYYQRGIDLKDHSYTQHAQQYAADVINGVPLSVPPLPTLAPLPNGLSERPQTPRGKTGWKPYAPAPAAPAASVNPAQPGVSPVVPPAASKAAPEAPKVVPPAEQPGVSPVAAVSPPPAAAPGVREVPSPAPMPTSQPGVSAVRPPEAVHAPTSPGVRSVTPTVEEAIAKVEKKAMNKWLLGAGVAAGAIGIIALAATPQHTTLESPSGKKMKRDMELPYKDHSATDFEKTAKFWDTLQKQSKRVWNYGYDELTPVVDTGAAKVLDAVFDNTAAHEAFSYLNTVAHKGEWESKLTIPDAWEKAVKSNPKLAFAVAAAAMLPGATMMIHNVAAWHRQQSMSEAESRAKSHQTLESATGQQIKSDLDLPYKKHSQFDYKKITEFFDKLELKYGSFIKPIRTVLRRLYTLRTEILEHLAASDNRFIRLTTRALLYAESAERKLNFLRPVTPSAIMSRMLRSAVGVDESKYGKMALAGLAGRDLHIVKAAGLVIGATEAAISIYTTGRHVRSFVQRNAAGPYEDREQKAEDKRRRRAVNDWRHGKAFHPEQPDDQNLASEIKDEALDFANPSGAMGRVVDFFQHPGRHKGTVAYLLAFGGTGAYQIYQRRSAIFIPGENWSSKISNAVNQLTEAKLVNARAWLGFGSMAAFGLITGKNWSDRLGGFGGLGATVIADIASQAASRYLFKFPVMQEGVARGLLGGVERYNAFFQVSTPKALEKFEHEGKALRQYIDNPKSLIASEMTAIEDKIGLLGQETMGPLMELLLLPVLTHLAKAAGHKIDEAQARSKNARDIRRKIDEKKHQQDVDNVEKDQALSQKAKALREVRQGNTPQRKRHQPPPPPTSSPQRAPQHSAQQSSQPQQDSAKHAIKVNTHINEKDRALDLQMVQQGHMQQQNRGYASFSYSDYHANP